MATHHAQTAPKLAAGLAENLPQGFPVLARPVAHPKKMRPRNSGERVNPELQRRPRGARLFPNEASRWRRVSAGLAEISEAGETGNSYLTMKNPTQPSV